MNINMIRGLYDEFQVGVILAGELNYRVNRCDQYVARVLPDLAYAVAAAEDAMFPPIKIKVEQTAWGPKLSPWPDPPWPDTSTAKGEPWVEWARRIQESTGVPNPDSYRVIWDKALMAGTIITEATAWPGVEVFKEPETAREEITLWPPNHQPVTDRP